MLIEVFIFFFYSWLFGRFLLRGLENIYYIRRWKNYYSIGRAWRILFYWRSIWGIWGNLRLMGIIM